MRFVNFNDDRGSAAIDLIGFGVLLQVPLLVLSFQLVSTQHDQLAAEGIARESIRAFMLLDRPPAETLELVAKDYRIPLSRVKIAVNCEPVDCYETQAFIRVVVEVGKAKASAVMQR